MSTSKSYLPYRLNETQRSLPLSASATTALAEPPDLLFEDGFLSGPVRRSLYRPRRTWTEECHAHLQPFSDPCCALKADRLVSWAHRPPRACACLPSSPAAPPLPLASCAQITRAALPLSKLTPILGISSLLLPQPGMLLPHPCRLAPSYHSEFKLPFSERPVLTTVIQNLFPALCYICCFLVICFN